jgi:hypothetical protein
MTTAIRADELAAFVYEEITDQQGEVDRQIMVSRVLRMLENTGLHDPPKAKAPVKPKPMSDEQARAFGEQEMTFGLWKGCAIKNIPREYLCYLVDPNEFSVELRRYLDQSLSIP